MNLLFVVPDKEKDLGNRNLAGRNRPAVKIKSVSGGRKLLSSGGTSCFRMYSVRTISKS